MNLNMPPDLIKTIAERGGAAGETLIRRFVPQSSNPATPGEDRPASAGWDDQRWVRLDVLVRTLADKSFGLSRALSKDVLHSTPYTTLLSRAGTDAPPGHEKPVTGEQAEALEVLLKALEGLSHAFNTHGEKYNNAQTPNLSLISFHHLTPNS